MSICDRTDSEIANEPNCASITNTTLAFCSGTIAQGQANSGNAQFELCAELCADGLQALFGWANCDFNIP